MPDASELRARMIEATKHMLGGDVDDTQAEQALRKFYEVLHVMFG